MAGVTPERLRRAVVAFQRRRSGRHHRDRYRQHTLYYVLGQGRAIRYGVGVGREGFTWSGVQTVSRKEPWPDWHPPAEMIARQPYLPRFMAGGPGNPLGAAAMYLGSSQYRIHGTNDPSTIGKFVSRGCIRLTNEDVADLVSRVAVGTKVVVLPKNAPHIAARPIEAVGNPHQQQAFVRCIRHRGCIEVDRMKKNSTMRWTVGAAAMLCVSLALRRPGAGFFLKPVRRLGPLARARHSHAVWR